MAARNGKHKTSETSSAATSNDRLVGWLISYALDRMGKAFEIRSGRTFLGNQELGERSITLNAEDISIAHAALSASTHHKVVLQDVFSQSGTFIAQSGAAQEQRVQGPIEVKHGDWLRFGNKTRFQVCLIDGPSR
jgi:hypothetical protein